MCFDNHQHRRSDILTIFNYMDSVFTIFAIEVDSAIFFATSVLFFCAFFLLKTNIYTRVEMSAKFEMIKEDL